MSDNENELEREHMVGAFTITFDENDDVISAANQHKWENRAGVAILCYGPTYKFQLLKKYLDKVLHFFFSHLKSIFS